MRHALGVMDTAGLEVRSINLAVGERSKALRALPFQVVKASVDAVDLQLPTWRRQLVLRVRGVRLELLQRIMPMVCL
jgi:hypothetical protein